MPRILVADDEIAFGLQLEELLIALGYEVAGVAGSGKEAVEMARRLRPDLILMDIIMPGEFDGIDAAEKIQGELDIPVVFMTGFTEEHLIKRAKHVEPYGYFFKPFNEAQIMACIDITMQKRHTEDRLRMVRDELELRVEEATVELLKINKDLKREIEERKRAEAALKESEEKARAILEATTEAIMLLDSRGTILAANSVLAGRFGKSMDSMLGSNLYELFPPALSRSRKAVVDEVFRSGNPVRVQDQRDGRTYDANYFPVFDVEGKVIQVAVFATDITETVEL
jgi:PAS domain S-box-containing protein